MAEKFEFFFFLFFKIASYPIQSWPENGRFMVKPTLLLKVLYNINKGRIYFFSGGRRRRTWRIVLQRRAQSWTFLGVSKCDPHL